MNKIVKIVHECAKIWDGIPANNNGDRYILSWKLPTVADCKANIKRSASGRSLGSADLNDPNVVIMEQIK